MQNFSLARDDHRELLSSATQYRKRGGMDLESSLTHSDGREPDGVQARQNPQSAWIPLKACGNDKPVFNGSFISSSQGVRELMNHSFVNTSAGCLPLAGQVGFRHTGDGGIQAHSNENEPGFPPSRKSRPCRESCRGNPSFSGPVRVLKSFITSWWILDSPAMSSSSRRNNC